MSYKLDQKKLYSVFIFLAKFFALSFVLHFFVWLNLDMSVFQRFIAKSVYFILNLFDLHIDLIGTAFILKDQTGVLIAEITRDCVAWKSILAFVCLIFATDSKNIKSKIKPMFIGILIIFFANIFRLATTLGFSKIYGIIYFDFIHNILWQGAMVILIILLWHQLYLKLFVFENK